MMSIDIMMCSFHRHTDEYSGQVGKNISLYECNQHFNQVNKNSKQHKEWRSAPTQARIHRAENKNEADET